MLLDFVIPFFQLIWRNRGISVSNFKGLRLDQFQAFG